MHHFVTEMCTCVHISVKKWCIVGHLSGIVGLWGLWDGSIDIKWHKPWNYPGIHIQINELFDPGGVYLKLMHIIIESIKISKHIRRKYWWKRVTSKRRHFGLFWCTDVEYQLYELHWNGNVFILMKFSSLAALEVVKMTTSSAASDQNFVKMTTFSFQWIPNLWNRPLPSAGPIGFAFHSSQ